MTVRCDWHLRDWHLRDWHLRDWHLRDWHLRDWHLPSPAAAPQSRGAAMASRRAAHA